MRTRVLSLDQIRDRFALLTGGNRVALPRHQTLRTTIDWSHDLLESGEQTLLRQLCVFAGNFTLEDVESVCDALSDRALVLLASLVEKSLVMKEDTPLTAYYHLHETMRQYAALKLGEAGEQELVEQRLVAYYRSKCERLLLEGPQQLVAWLDWTDLEIDNIRAVLRRCLDDNRVFPCHRARDLHGAVLDHPRDQRRRALARRGARRCA